MNKLKSKTCPRGKPQRSSDFSLKGRGGECSGANPPAESGAKGERIALRHRRAIWLPWIALVWFSASGASCPYLVRQYTQPVPRALPPQASLTQIIDVVNDNSARVQALSSSRATFNTPGAPTLNARIAFQRPRSFRLIAQKFSPEFDLGSNDELFWFWIARAQPPAMYFCRHEQFSTSAARQLLPVEPEWLIEAFGVVTFDKSAPIEGPFPVGNGRVELKTRSLTPGGVSRLTVIDDSRGVVVEQHVYDAQGIRLAHATMSKHVRDPVSGATLPHHVEIQFPPANLSITIDMADLQVNQLSADPRELFAKPLYNSYPDVDLANPNNQLVPNAAGNYRASPDVRYQ